MPLWEIQGASTTDGRDLKYLVEGKNEQEVRRWAQKNDMLVSSVEPAKPSPLPPLQPSSEQDRLLREINESLKSISGWVSLAGIIFAACAVIALCFFLRGLLHP